MSKNEPYRTASTISTTELVEWMRPIATRLHPITWPAFMDLPLASRHEIMMKLFAGVMAEFVDLVLKAHGFDGPTGFVLSKSQ